MLSRFFSLGMKMKKEVDKVMIGCCVKFSEKFVAQLELIVGGLILAHAVIFMCMCLGCVNVTC